MVYKYRVRWGERSRMLQDKSEDKMPPHTRSETEKKWGSTEGREDKWN